MKTLLLFTLIVFGLTVDLNSIFTNRQQQTLVQLKKSKWGSWMIEFAELHIQTQGLVDTIMPAIQDVIAEMDNELTNINDQFKKIQSTHIKETSKLQQLINDAEGEIFNAKDFNDNVLIPQRDRIAQALNYLEQNIDQNRNNLIAETSERQNDTANLDQHISEFNQGISAIDQSLSAINNPNTPSLLQVKQIQQNIQNLNAKLKNHSFFSPLVSALLQLTTDQNFQNQISSKEIINQFNQLRSELQSEIRSETLNQNKLQQNFEARIKQINQEYEEFLRNKEARQIELSQTQAKILENNKFIAQNEADKSMYQEQLQAESDNFAIESKINMDIIAQQKQEYDASQQALSFIAQSAFFDYAKAKVSL